MAAIDRRNKVFTVFFCGTGYDENASEKLSNIYPKGELISTLAKNHAGQEGTDWMILSGPGEPGSGLIGYLQQWTGDGMDTNAKKALQKILTISDLKVVNMVGWSRGGITCHMLANQMDQQDSLRGVKVNIFTVDPVPGPGNFGQAQISIPSNVNNYTAAYARDERSKGFYPIIPGVNGTTNVQYIPFPGNHMTLVGTNTINGKQETKKEYFLAVGQLVRDQVEKFLTNQKTDLNNMLNLNDFKCLEFYHTIVLNGQEFVRMRKYSIDGFTEDEKGERIIYEAKNVQEKKKFSDIKSLEPIYVTYLDAYLKRLKALQVKSKEKGLLIDHINLLKDKSGFLNLHHSNVVTTVTKSLFNSNSNKSSQANALNLLEGLSRFSLKQVNPKFFPYLESGFNQAFSEDPILLNGMEVILDQPIPVSPVKLQPKGPRR